MGRQCTEVASWSEAPAPDSAGFGDVFAFHNVKWALNLCKADGRFFLLVWSLLSFLQQSFKNYDEEMIRRIFSALSSYSVTGTNYISGRTFIESYMKRVSQLFFFCFCVSSACTDLYRRLE